MELRELRPGLYRWTARHPDWEADAEPESPADWPEEVGSVAYCTPDSLVLVDPLVPDGDWDALDGLAAGKTVLVLTTLPFHGRSSDAVLERYGGTRDRSDGVEPVELPRFGETMFWIPEHGALVPGDRLLGDGDGGLRLCPGSWLRYLSGKPTESDLRGELRERLLELPIELVVVSHGEPVVENGRAAIDRALRD